MLMKDDKKSAVALIVSKAKGPSNIDNMKPPMAEDSESTGPETAAEELLAAIQSNDPKQVVEAFKALMEMCDMPEMESEEY